MRSSGLRSANPSLLPREDDGWRERVHRIDEHIVCVSCGLVPDARQLLRALQRLANEHRKAWGSRMPVDLVAARLSEFVQAATLRASTRPFGAAFLLAGYDDDTQSFRLFRTDPAGVYDEITGASTIAGEAPTVARDAVDRGYRPDLDADGATCLVLDGIAASRGKDATAPLRPTDLELARLTLRDDRVVSDIVAFNEIAAILADHALPIPPTDPSDFDVLERPDDELTRPESQRADEVVDEFDDEEDDLEGEEDEDDYA